MLRPPLVGVDRLHHPRPVFRRRERLGERVPPDLAAPLSACACLAICLPSRGVDRAGPVPYLRPVAKLDIITLPGSQASHEERARRAHRRRAPEAHGRHAGDHVRRARHRAGGHPGRRAPAASSPSTSPNARTTRRPPIRSSSSTRRSCGPPTTWRSPRRAACRSRSTSPRSSARRRSASPISTARASVRRSRRRACSPSASSTRSTTSTASCSSTTCPS